MSYKLDITELLAVAGFLGIAYVVYDRVTSSNDAKNAEALFYLLSCVRKLERAGDLTKNIAEELIFSVESKVIKHRKNKR